MQAGCLEGLRGNAGRDDGPLFQLANDYVSLIDSQEDTFPESCLGKSDSFAKAGLSFLTGHFIKNIKGPGDKI